MLIERTGRSIVRSSLQRWVVLLVVAAILFFLPPVAAASVVAMQRPQAPPRLVATVV